MTGDPSTPAPGAADAATVEANNALQDALWAENARLPDRAVASYRRVIELFPDVWEVHNNLANLLLDMNRPAEALESARRAVALRPADPLVNANVGRACLRLNRPEEAIPALEAALRARPDLLPVREMLAGALLETGRPDDGAALFKAIEPAAGNDFAVLATMAKYYLRARLGMDAERCLVRMLNIDPRHEHTIGDLALLYMDYVQFTRAAEVARKGLEVAPESGVFWNTLANAQASMGQVDQALATYRKVLEVAPRMIAAHSNLLLTLHYVSGVDPAEIFAEHRRFGERHAPPRLAIRQHPNVPDPERRLRIAYVSPDIRTHSVAFFLEPLLDHRDRDRFEVYCYAQVKAPDQVTQRLKGKVDHFRNGHDLPSIALAQAIRGDGVDILIDLAGHAGTLHPDLLAYKAAPVQVTYLGYPDTTGIEAVDYRVTDALADPPGAEAFHTERLVRIPDGFLCFKPPPEVPATGPPPALAAGHVTFGSFNREFKVSEHVLDLWCRILAAVPGSRLMMKCVAGEDPGCREYQLGRFARRGIDPARIDLVGFIGAAKDHLATYRQVDVALDTFPYHGTTTTLDSLLMGVPVVTLAGNNHASRVGVSLLAQVGLPDLIARTDDEYVAKAVDLARHPERVAALHGSLRAKLLASTLCDGPGFTRKFEFALRGMWYGWCRDRGVALTPAQDAQAAFDFSRLG